MDVLSSGTAERVGSTQSTLVCFSHLRWDYVRQRPQHLMRRFAAERPLWFWEEAIPCDHALPYLEYHHFPDDDLIALRPRIPSEWTREQAEAGLADLFSTFEEKVLRGDALWWFYTPTMFAFVRDGTARAPEAIVYDCMDELSAFHGADADLMARETELLTAADVVFTGGHSLYEAKAHRNANVHAFPSAVDVAHFRGTRAIGAKADGRARPTFGWCGVIDERFDLALIEKVAKMRPEWDFELIGPVVKIDPAILPQEPNLHWSGPAHYDTLPQRFSNWDVALMPFARNRATEFISPTKTPEYLAAGLPVVSTAIRDVVSDYGAIEGVWIADGAHSFVAACDAALALRQSGSTTWLAAVDHKLADHGWDQTQRRMRRLVDASVDRRATKALFRTMPRVARAKVDTLIVAAGFAGAVMAERLAADAGQRVLVVDRRPHIGGNAYDEKDAAGVLIHRYGPHIFHTNSADVFAYLSRFTDWRPYEHRVLASVRGMLVPMPINRTTLEQLFGVTLDSEDDAARFLEARAEPVSVVKTSEDVVISAVGRELYELFFQGYTRKQWGLDPSQLDKSVTARVPTRTSRDDRYFLDSFQAMPAAGYTAMFERMLDHPNIEILTGVEYRDIVRQVSAEHLVFTGPIDEYFDYRFGRLPYRSLEFRHQSFDCEQFQPVAVVNYPETDTPYTRITEYKHLTGQQHPTTSVTYEYPSATGDPYYPIPREENAALFRRYEELAKSLPDVTFVGRLANYRYYNMDQVVGQALATYRRLDLTRADLVAVG